MIQTQHIQTYHFFRGSVGASWSQHASLQASPHVCQLPLFRRMDDVVRTISVLIQTALQGGPRTPSPSDHSGYGCIGGQHHRGSGIEINGQSRELGRPSKLHGHRRSRQRGKSIIPC